MALEPRRHGTESAETLSVASVLAAWETPVALIAPDYTILDANGAYREAFGWKGPGRGEKCHEVSHHSPVPCDQAGECCPLREMPPTGRTCQSLHIHFTEAGREHHEVSMRPLRDESGNVVGYLEHITPFETVSARPCEDSPVGVSSAFRRALDLVRRVAPSETAVLLLGETGTGKEVLAKTVHELSAHSHAPFVPVDCSGLTESLFESELFGHEKGSFTGATQRKRGLIEAAEGGTLFLDEVGDIPLNLQVKLLRLLESNTYRRVGSPREYRADHRLICATHQDLEGMVRAGTFRPDLYYRISAFPITVPPLRERPQDLPLLVESLLRRLRPGRRLRLTREALLALEGYEFPGNVRELSNLLERAVLLADGDRIDLEHLPPRVVGGASVAPGAALPGLGTGPVLSLEEQEQRYLEWAVARHGGDNRSLAESLGVSERTLYRKLRGLRQGGSALGTH